jgi:protein TonB
MKRRLTFTLYHGFAVSLALHALLGLPFVLNAAADPPEDAAPLVVELKGVVADSQTEEKVQQQTAGAPKQEVAEAAKPAQASAAPASEPSPKDLAPDGADASTPPPEPSQTPVTPKSQTTSEPASATTIAGVEDQQNAQTIKTDQDDIDRLREYVKVLTKKVQANLLYPDEGRQAGLHGTATVSFTILATGQIRPESLKIVESSGRPQLDASALKTIRASVPFGAPPQEMTVAIAVAFGRKP